MNAVIIANTPIAPPKAFHSLISKADLMIAADGGARHFLSMNLMPHILVGDLDSIETEIWERLHSGTKIIQFPKDKDLTDLELACREAQKAGAKSLKVFSWADEHFDYTWATLLGFRDISIPTTLYGSDFEVRILNAYNPEHSWDLDKQRLSVGSLSENVSLRSSGLKWELDWNNRSGPQLSLSNESTGPSNLVISRGSAFLILNS